MQSAQNLDSRWLISKILKTNGLLADFEPSFTTEAQRHRVFKELVYGCWECPTCPEYLSSWEGSVMGGTLPRAWDHDQVT